MGQHTGDVGASLRRWASESGDPQMLATVELVIRYGLADYAYPWIRHGVANSRWPDDWVDFRTLAKVAERTPGEDGIVMKVAASFGLGHPVSPAVLHDLNDERRSYVLSAIGQRPAGEWPPQRTPPLIPSEVIADVAAAERRGMDRLLSDIAEDDTPQGES